MMLGVKLAPGISKMNMVTFYYASFASIAFFVYLNAAQAFILPVIYGVKTEEMGRVSGLLSLWDQLCSILMMGVCGTLSDKIGRRFVYVSGFVLKAISLAFYPHGGSIYPGLLIFRLFFAVGGAASASMLTAVLADYAVSEDKGKASGFMGIMAGLGALLSVFYFVRLPTYYSKADSGDTRLLQEHFARALSNSTTDAITKESINASYYTMSGFALVTAILLFVGLKKDHERVYHPNQEVHHYEIKPRKTQEEIEKEKEKSNESQVRHQETATDEDAKNMWQTFLLGFREARNPAVALAYGAGFIARGDSVINSVFITLWVNKYFINEGVCGEEVIYEDSVCREAYVRSSAVSGVIQLCALLFAPLTGVMMDKPNRIRMLGVFSMIGAVSYGSVLGITNPTGPAIMILAAFMGISQISMIIGSQVIVADSAPPQLRGSVSGCFSLCGGVGIMVGSQIGGILFDMWTESAPFFIFGVFNAILAIFCFALLLRGYNSTAATTPKPPPPDIEKS